MSFLNTDILIQNITMLMKDHKMTQEKLAEILGMSQPNVSKALSLKDKKCFTLDQIAGIADHFGVSIDSLVGNTSFRSQETGPRAVAEFLSKVIESHDAKCTKINVEEKVFESEERYDVEYGRSYEDIVERNRVSSYIAVYFPSFWQLPDPSVVGQDVFEDMEAEAWQIGNESRMKPVNDFLRKFIKIFNLYDKKELGEDEYRIVIDSFLSKLRER